jgi:hypothetical protein
MTHRSPLSRVFRIFYLRKNLNAAVIIGSSRLGEADTARCTTSIYGSPSTAHLNGLQAPAMGGVHASLHHVAVAVVIVGIVVRIVVIVVVRVVAAEAESKAAPEVAVVPEAAIMVEAATRFAATETTIMERHAAAECAAAVATMETATTHRHAAAVETSTAHTHAAAVETASATTKAAATAAVAATTAAATARQRHCWRSQANRCNCQQRDHRLTQHDHSPSEIPLPTSTRIARGDRSGEALLASTSPLLNSAREIKLKFSKRVVRPSIGSWPTLHCKPVRSVNASAWRRSLSAICFDASSGFR